MWSFYFSIVSPNPWGGPAKHPSSLLHHSKSLPSETAVTEGSTKHTQPTTQQKKKDGRLTHRQVAGLNWRSVQGTLLDVRGRRRDAYGRMCWGFTRLWQIVYTHVHFSIHLPRERTLLTANVLSSVWCFRAFSLPVNPSPLCPLPSRPVKNPLSCTLPKPWLSTSV